MGFLDLSYSGTFQIHDIVLNIRTDSMPALRNMQEECGYFEVSGSPLIDFTVCAINDFRNVDNNQKKSDMTFSYSINSRTRLMVDVRNKIAILYSTDVQSMPFYLWQVTESLVLAIMREKGIPCMHAAVLEKNGTGFLFPAMICSGKTTLTIELVKNGYRYLADDLVFINDKLETLCFPTRIGVTEYTRERFFDIMSSENMIKVPYSHKKYFRLDNVFPGSIAHKCMPEYILLPSPGKMTELQKIDRAEALARIIPSMYNDNELLGKYHKITGFDKSIIFERAADLVEATEHYELKVGESGLAETLDQLLSS